jgi:hypothetical protein
LGVQVVNPFQVHIERDPRGFASFWLDSIRANRGFFDSSNVENIRARFNVDKKEHYRYLSQVISQRLPGILKNSHLDQAQINDIVKNLTSMQFFIDECFIQIQQKIKSIININMGTLEYFIMDFKPLEVADSFNAMLVEVGLDTALSTVARFIKLILKLLKNANQELLKTNVINQLKALGTKKSILQLMKLLQIQEFTLALTKMIVIDDRSRLGSYDPTFFKLTEDGIEFNSERIDLNSYSSRCPVDHTASPLDKSSPNGIKQEKYDSSRFGCPASSRHLDLVINHFEKIINLVPDEKFNEWMTSS